MKVIRTGITRTVILTRKYAIKIPSLRGGSRGAWLWSFCRGVLANQSEVEWSCVPGVNPVLKSYWGVVNVYKRLEVLTDIDMKNLDIRMIAPEYVHVDPKADNIGWLHGGVGYERGKFPVWIDYDMSWNGPKHL